MNFEVHFSSAAEADIDQIFDYISITLCSPIAAKNLMAKFQESVNTLSDFPEAFINTNYVQTPENTRKSIHWSRRCFM